MKDKYREETNKDVYPDDTPIRCVSNCGSYTDDYVHWLEMQVKKLNTSLVSNRIYTVVDKDGDLINCWKHNADAEKHAEDLRKELGAYFEATEQPLF